MISVRSAAAVTVKGLENYGPEIPEKSLKFLFWKRNSEDKHRMGANLWQLD